MEYAQFGDTELTVSDLKSNIDKLKAVPDGKTASPMQEQFDVINCGYEMENFKSNDLQFCILTLFVLTASKSSDRG